MIAGESVTTAAVVEVNRTSLQTVSGGWFSGIEDKRQPAERRRGSLEKSLLRNDVTLARPREMQKPPPNGGLPIRIEFFWANGLIIPATTVP
jgi:hypothetical protein